MFDEGQAGTESILRWKAADRDMHWLAHDERLAAIGEITEAEMRAGLERFTFHTKIAMQPPFVLCENRYGDKDQQRDDCAANHLFFPFIGMRERGLLFFFGRSDIGFSAAAAISSPRAGAGGRAGMTIGDRMGCTVDAGLESRS